jgi:hypothetical protein
VMHALIAHFQQIAPTWLLLESDWAHTKQAAPFMPYCSDIVAIGRVKWIEGSKHTGKDNSAWYRFHADHTSGTVFHARDLPTPARRRTCERCGKAYEQERSTARFCSPACLQGAYRNRLLSVTEAALARQQHAQHQRRLIDLKYRRDEDVVREAEEALDCLAPPKGAA